MTNKASGQDKHILGPYKLDYRKKLLRQILESQRQIDRENPGAAFSLITKPELEAIRVHWRMDPNEPDWEDPVPKLYAEVMGVDLDWEINDDFLFSGEEERLIAELCAKHGLAKELFMKLIELQLSFEGFTRRSKLQERISDLVTRDWSAETDAITRQLGRRATSRDLEEQEAVLHKRYADLGKIIADAT
jgi:DNA sulfur modification protein DndC